MKKIIPVLVFLTLWSCHVVAQDQNVPVLSSPTVSGTGAKTTSSNVWPNDAALSNAQKNFQYSGSLKCANCHVAAQPGNQEEKVTDFVLLSEFQIWINDDPHARAYLNIIPDQSHFSAVTDRRNRLNERVNQAARANGLQTNPIKTTVWEESSNQRSLNMLMEVGDATEQEVRELFRQMTERFDFLVTDQSATENPSKLIGTVKLCMSCHAGWDNRQPSFDTEVVKYGTGVSCEGCHGASSQWLAEHADSQWRKLDPDVKQKTYGLYNTRQPIARSKQCYSCHIGDAEQGKVVTHEMYAAGHPPLPSIEIESFADQIPRHWRYQSEKKEFVFATDFRENFFADLGIKKDENGSSPASANTEFPRTKNLLVAGVMASAQSVELLADSAKHAELAQKTNQADSAWPEFAVFDCAACHHDLKADGWERGFAGVPGRPPVPYWPRALSKLGIAYLSAQQHGNLYEDYLANEKSLQDALDRQPFGQPEELTAVGHKYSQWLQTNVAQQIQSKRLTRKDAIDVLQLLCRDSQNSEFNSKDVVWDFHSARQLAWAINLIYSEITQPPMPSYAEFANQTEAFMDATERLYAFTLTPTNEFEIVLEELRKDLMLDLIPTGEITPQQKKFLDTWRNFDRKQFIERLARLREASERNELFNHDGKVDKQP